MVEHIMLTEMAVCIRRIFTLLQYLEKDLISLLSVYAIPNDEVCRAPCSVAGTKVESDFGT